MVTRFKHGCQAFINSEATQGEATANALSKSKHVRFYTAMHVRKPFTATSYTGLNFVKNQESIVLVAQSTYCL